MTVPSTAIPSSSEVINKPIEYVNMYNTREQCEHIANNYERAACYPVNVKNREDVIEQINAINIMVIKDGIQKKDSSNYR